MDDEIFKLAMSRFPSGVTIVTTINKEGEKCGFTASAFSSLSMSPPLVLVCLANSADCYDYFVTGSHFAVNIIGKEHEELAFKFATKGIEKFEGEKFKKYKYYIFIKCLLLTTYYSQDVLFGIELGIRH